MTTDQRTVADQFAEALGGSIIGTGGGCTAIEIELGERGGFTTHVLVTDGDAGTDFGEWDDAHVLVMGYDHADDEGQEIFDVVWLDELADGTPATIPFPELIARVRAAIDSWEH